MTLSELLHLVGQANDIDIDHDISDPFFQKNAKDVHPDLVDILVRKIKERDGKHKYYRGSK